ncbi:MAG: regulatory signaling modulator protein AmpE [Gammaproteobacteria bacterium]|nr:regulatory signaling modulator protein AmpE [Gammaproteobacteria bacterium]
MAFLSVILALVVDRFVPELAARRNENWYRRGFAILARHVPLGADLKGLLLAVLAIAVPAVLAALLMGLMSGMSWVLGFAFGTLVLMFMLGPKSPLAEAARYDAALAAEDEEAAEAVAERLLEAAVPSDPLERTRAVVTRLLVLSSRNLFAVIFWFVLLGPAGAVAFRVADILRHQAEEITGCDEAQGAAQKIFGLLEWAPSRLLSGCYALAGSFDDAIAERRAYFADCSGRFFEINDDILACTGRGALNFPAEEASARSEFTAVMNLLNRSLVIWLASLALLTIFGWL